MTENAIAQQIVDAAFRIHTTLGPGLLESVYDTVLAYELNRNERVTKPTPLFALMDRGVIHIALEVQEEQADLCALMRRYRNRPMSLADACLVRLSGLHPDGEVFTLDSDFRVYRRHGNKVIPLLIWEQSDPAIDA